MNASLKHQRGFNIIAAVFLITAVAVILGAMVTTMSARSRTTTLNYDASRAYYAARSGVEVAIARAVAAGCGAVPGTVTVDGFNVALGCNAVAADEAGVAYNVYTVTATAAAGNLNQPTFVSRELRATVTDAP